MTVTEIRGECFRWYVSQYPADEKAAAAALTTPEPGRRAKHGPRRHYSHIRRLCIAWFAAQHPEIDMKIVGEAVGMVGHSVYIAVSGRDLGRKRGCGSSCYVRQNMLHRIEVEDDVVKYISSHPEAPYREIAVKFDLERSVVNHIALRHGMRRGRGFSKTGPAPLVSDERVREFFRERPLASPFAALRFFGYRSKGGGTVERLKRLRDEVLSKGKIQ